MIAVTPHPLKAKVATPATEAGRAHSMTMEAATLTTLLAAAGDGDAESWAEIVRRFTGLLWAVARSHRLNKDDAADVVQCTWLRLLENVGRIDQPEALPGWLSTTARREALNLIRRRARQTPVDEGYLNSVDSPAPELDLDLLIEERDTHLGICFDQLPVRDRRLLGALTACDRPSYTAIAADLNMPIGSIGPTRMRALRRLRALLDASDYTFCDGRPQPTP